MALEIVWSDEANQQLDEIIAHFEEYWTEKEISNFFIRLEEGLAAIKESPHRYNNSLRKPGTKEFVLSPHTTIFYTYDTSHLYILLLWPNRRDPQGLE